MKPPFCGTAPDFESTAGRIEIEGPGRAAAVRSWKDSAMMMDNNGIIGCPICTVYVEHLELHQVGLLLTLTCEVDLKHVGPTSHSGGRGSLVFRRVVGRQNPRLPIWNLAADWCGVDINYGKGGARITRHDELVQPGRLGTLKVCRARSPRSLKASLI